MAIPSCTKFGSYEISGAIGTGGMGEVYQAHDAKLERDVAIKVPPKALGRDAERLSRFQCESKMLAALIHLNMAAIHGLGHSDGLDFLIVELASGGPPRSLKRKDFL